MLVQELIELSSGHNELVIMLVMIIFGIRDRIGGGEDGSCKEQERDGEVHMKWGAGGKNGRVQGRVCIMNKVLNVLDC
jgi:hypothetical protein